MTCLLLPHQRAALNEPRYGRRQQLYKDGTIHDLDAAIKYLRENIVGFLVPVPLDWGRDTKIVGDPSKATGVRVDITQVDSESIGRNKA